jgi:hypothetical protein
MGRDSDLATNTVRLTLGGRSHQIIDYAGQEVGMPAVVTQFEQEIDDVLARAVRHRLSPPGLAQLAGAGFRFDTPAGIAVLERAGRASGNSDDKSQLAIFERLAAIGKVNSHDHSSLPAPNGLAYCVRL